jgi:hypothetical protein
MGTQDRRQDAGQGFLACEMLDKSAKAHKRACRVVCKVKRPLRRGAVSEGVHEGGESREPPSFMSKLEQKCLPVR